MDVSTRKLNFIQDLLSVSDEKIIGKLESLLKKEKQKEVQKPSVYDLLGVLTKEEGEEMEKTIKSCCEKIHDEDWK
ncbi:hypothetical protein [Cyclobacterium plantarum]|uniref:Uncharacterized protein n=1 Tax=Cyclobacterium plantarum TaxID=2716263 RepID=A0ABX0H3D1_9BACT|nr:hypothetical protein [Cyclobacterium plantarum]NHE56124.1 hypothetical protein [Cyclobacterium plantarum]